MFAACSLVDNNLTISCSYVLAFRLWVCGGGGEGEAVKQFGFIVLAHLRCVGRYGRKKTAWLLTTLFDLCAARCVSR